jgi:hypothetical protein
MVKARKGIERANLGGDALVVARVAAQICSDPIRAGLGSYEDVDFWLYPTGDDARAIALVVRVALDSYSASVGADGGCDSGGRRGRDAVSCKAIDPRRKQLGAAAMHSGELCGRMLKQLQRCGDGSTQRHSQRGGWVLTR